MSTKYLDFLKRIQDTSQVIAEEIDKELPLSELEPPARAEKLQIINSHDVPPNTVVASILDIQTHGPRHEPMEMLQRFLGRQPILDASHQIIGYELKLRNKEHIPEIPKNSVVQRMQDERLVVSVIDLDYLKALGSKLTFISVSATMLDNPFTNDLPRQKVAVGIRLGQGASANLLERCRDLVRQGIPVVLEDFHYRPEHEPFLRLCSYVRVDTTQSDALALGQQINEITKNSSAHLIAKNVETEDAFEAYRAMSFKFFQGYYFTQLQPSAPHRMNSNRIRVMELLNMAMSHAEISELEAKFKLDPALSYRLLNYINSPANRLPQKIHSIGHALVLLGYDQLYRWLTLLLFASGKPDQRARTLLKNTLVRARFTEILGNSHFNRAEQGGLFIVGIFSLLDALLNVPMERALAKLSLPDPIMDALLRRTGIYASYLQLAIACEDCDHENIAHHTAACSLNAEEVNLAHVNAMIWAEEIES